MMSESKWLAAYIYYNEPWEEFLSKAMKPFIESTVASGDSDRFFFIRYWEKGPHIRLRFHGNANVLNEKVKPAIDEYFGSYFQNNPSLRTDPEWLKEQPEEWQWYPNNSIQYIDYEPETERYGGPEAIIVAEKQFELSSKVILDIMEDSEGWDYDRALGAAIQLHLAFAYALEMDHNEARHFYAHTFQSWLPRAYNDFFTSQLPEEEAAARREKTLKAFEVTFEKQKEPLVEFHREMWEALHEGSEFEQAWIHTWIDGMREVNGELKALQDAGKLIGNYPGFYKQESAGIPVKSKERWAIYDSYVHMTNNRLGIRNQDEGYLGYILKRCLEEM